MTLAARRWAALGLLALAFAVLTALDRPLILELARPDLRHEPWRLALKQVGHLFFWIAVGAITFAWKRDWRWPAALVGSAVLGGALAEIGKLVFGRERPIREFVLQNGGHYVWKDGPLGPFLAGFWDSSNLGLPSSHAAVAFGGAVILGVLDRRLRTPALILATGCALTRVIDGAHFPTDVLLGAVLGGVAASLIARLGRPGGPAAPPDTIAH